MKLRLIPSILIFISSYFPLALIVIIKDLDERTFLPQHLTGSLIVFVSCFISIFVVIISAKYIRGGIPLIITKVSNKSGDMFTYTIPYMVSFYRFDLGDWKALASISVFMVLMFILTYRTQNQLVNPVLAIAGYGLYDCQFKNGDQAFQGLVISKYILRIGDTCVTEKLSQYLYFASEVITKEKVG